MFKYQAKVVHIVDGDTVDVVISLGFNTFSEQRIRLYGINTPETRTRDDAEKKRGLIAKEFLREQLMKVEYKIELHTFQDEQGKFGRYLGNIFIQRGRLTNLNKLMVKEGHAVENYYGNPKTSS